MYARNDAGRCVLRAVLAAACVWSWAQHARAERAPALPVAKLSAELASGDPARSSAAIDALGERGGRDALVALAEFVRSGQPDALTDRALGALGTTRSPDAIDALAAMTHHRRASARIAAFASIARIPGERANGLL